MFAPKVKVKQPDTYTGDRGKLPTWLADVTLYFQSIGWREGHADEKIIYTSTLLRGDASRWLTPFTKGISEKTWNT